MNVQHKNEERGVFISYDLEGNGLTLNEELVIKLNKYERDDPAHIDVCLDRNKNLVMGVIPGVADLYAAQIDIPAREYDYIEDGVDDDGNPKETAVPIEFDADRITLTLWGLED
jgi:hypothetical protein